MVPAFPPAPPAIIIQARPITPAPFLPMLALVQAQLGSSAEYLPRLKRNWDRPFIVGPLTRGKRHASLRSRSNRRKR